MFIIRKSTFLQKVTVNNHHRQTEKACMYFKTIQAFTLIQQKYGLIIPFMIEASLDSTFIKLLYQKRNAFVLKKTLLVFKNVVNRNLKEKLYYVPSFAIFFYQTSVHPPPILRETSPITYC